MSAPTHFQKPLKLAIIGGGPSAFYVASRILKLLPPGPSPSGGAGEGDNVRVHLFDRLWAPHGLVRYGVAPDHPEVKNCTHKFDQTALDPRFKFFGNVNVLTSTSSSSSTASANTTLKTQSETAQPQPNPPNAIPLPLTSLLKSYTHIVFATGAPVALTHPSLPPYNPRPPSTSNTHPDSTANESNDTPTPNSRHIPALSLVHFYTSHPSAPPPPPLHAIKHVSIIGNGNVALDVARMLLTPVDVLRKYDIPEKVLEWLGASVVEHVSIIARRGWREAAFSVKEVREMMGLEGVAMVPLSEEILGLGKESRRETLTRPQKRVLELLKEGSKARFGSTRKTWSLDFLRAPVGLVPASASSPSTISTSPSTSPTSPTTISLASSTPPTSSSSSPSTETQTPHDTLHQKHQRALTLLLERTTIDPLTSKARGTGHIEELPTDLVISSLGFEGERGTVFYEPSLRHIRVGSPSESEAGAGAGAGTVSAADGAAGVVNVGIGAAQGNGNGSGKGGGVGRVLNARNQQVPGVYASGWAGMGARGVLVATMMDAYAVAGSVIEDWRAGVQVSVDAVANAISGTSVSASVDANTAEDSNANADLDLDPNTQSTMGLDAPPREVLQALGEGKVTTYDDWKRVDAEERRRGEERGKERERMGWREARRYLRGEL